MSANSIVTPKVGTDEDTWISDLRSSFEPGECQSTVGFDDHPCAGSARWYAQLTVLAQGAANPHWEGKLCDPCLAGWREWAAEEPEVIQVVSVHPIVEGR